MSAFSAPLALASFALPALGFTPPEAHNPHAGVGMYLSESLWGPAFDFTQYGPLSLTGLALFIAGILASAAGIGGGGIFVAVLMFGLGLDPHVAVPLSKAIIFGGAVMSYRKNRTRVNPETQLPLIDIELVKNIVPSALAGTLFGVFLNLKFSPLLLVACLSTLLTAMSVKTFAKAISMYREENGTAGLAADRREPLLNAEAGRVPNAQQTILDDIRKQAFSAYYTRDMILLFLLLGVIVFCGVSRHTLEEQRALSAADDSYQFKHSMLLLVPVGICVLLQTLFRSSLLPTARATLNPDAGPPSLYFPLVSFFAGICSGLFGIGGGLIFSPFLLQMGIDGQVTTVTSATCVIFTATSTTAQYLLMGRIILPLAFIYGAVSSLSSSIGTTLPATMERRFGRKSAVVFIVAVAVAVSAVLTIAKAVVISAPEIFLVSTGPASHASPLPAGLTLAGFPGHNPNVEAFAGHNPNLQAYENVRSGMPSKTHNHQHHHYHTSPTSEETEKESHEVNGKFTVEPTENSSDTREEWRSRGHHGSSHHSHHSHHSSDHHHSSKPSSYFGISWSSSGNKPDAPDSPDTKDLPDAVAPITQMEQEAPGSVHVETVFSAVSSNGTVHYTKSHKAYADVPAEGSEYTLQKNPKVASPEAEQDYRKDPVDMSHVHAKNPSHTSGNIKSPHVTLPIVGTGDIDHIPDPEVTSRVASPGNPASPDDRVGGSFRLTTFAQHPKDDRVAVSGVAVRHAAHGDIDHIPDPEVAVSGVAVRHAAHGDVDHIPDPEITHVHSGAHSPDDRVRASRAGLPGVQDPSDGSDPSDPSDHSNMVLGASDPNDPNDQMRSRVAHPGTTPDDRAAHPTPMALPQDPNDPNDHLRKTRGLSTTPDDRARFTLAHTSPDDLRGASSPPAAHGTSADDRIRHFSFAHTSPDDLRGAGAPGTTPDDRLRRVTDDLPTV